MEQNKALNLLSLAKKGGNIQMGEENVGAVCRAGRARLILLASDASDNAFRRARGFSAGAKVWFIRVPYSRQELGAAGGRAVCSMAAFTDVQLAQAFVVALNEPEKYADLLEELERRVQRVKKRRQEEKAHRSNVRHGKK